MERVTLENRMAEKAIDKMVEKFVAAGFTVSVHRKTRMDHGITVYTTEKIGSPEKIEIKAEIGFQCRTGIKFIGKMPSGRWLSVLAHGLYTTADIIIVAERIWYNETEIEISSRG